MNIFTAKWPFYVSGPLLALLSILALYLFNNPPGLSDAMTVANEYCTEVANHQRDADDLPALDWQFGLLLGIFIGALLTSLVCGTFKAEISSDGDGSFTVKALRTVGGGIAGGLLVMLGVQFAGDTVFGQITSAIQMSGGAWLFLISMVISGCGMAVLLERRGEGGGKSSGKSGGKPAAKSAPKKGGNK